jgi:hypothetical protein
MIVTKRIGYFTFVIMLVFSMVLTSCNFPGTTPTVVDLGANQTAVAQTIIALQTELAVNGTPIVPVLGTPTPAVLPTATLVPTVPLPTVPPLPTSTPLPSFKIGTVTDVTFVDHAVVKPGEAFKKTWRLQNAGTGSWNLNFKLIFISGDAMGAPATKALGQTVAPGQTIDISLDLVAPTAPKEYRGYYMLQTDGGVNFGIGANANATFWVWVKVEQAFAVTAAVPVAVPPTYTGICPFPIVLTANITTTAAGTVSYYFITSMGNTPPQELVFTAAGTKTTAAYPLVVPTSMALTVKIYIDTPNHQEFPTVLTIPVSCIP